MRVILTCLNAGDFFELDGMTYKKLEDREHGNRVEDINGDVRKMPLMAMITKVEKPKKKRVAKASKAPEAPEAPEVQSDSVDQLTDYPEDDSTMNSDYPN